MNWIPKLELGVLNGWLFFLVYIVIFAITLKFCPPEVRKRLYDRSLWTRRTKIITFVGKVFSFANIIMILFGALVIGTPEFIIGTILYLAGLSLLVVGIIHYRNAPLDEPITTGVYRYSRNPQMLGLYILFMGMILVIGSWINLIFLVISAICAHFSVLGEEKSLEQQYGDSYLEFKRKIPRYFLI